ncbi:MAG: hypothetical protein II653_06835, partial [Lachnospiraceae bacterium]|nr:hypothetical protein [Lachnospiraceae bacterium]
PESYNRSFWLFKSNTTNPSYNNGSWRFGITTLLDNGVLVCNFIPCKNASNVIGMFDLVSGQFFTNAGTGNFIAGPDAVPTPDTPVDIVCNNGVLKFDNINQEIYADGTVETIEVDTTGDAAETEMLLKVGDYQDVQSIIDGAVTRKVGIKVLDGTEGWNYYSVAQGVLFRITIANSVSDGKNASGVLCNAYRVVSVGNRTSGTLSGTTTNYDFINDDYTTVDDWKAYLADQYAAGTPVIIVYPLATSTTETVTG